MPEQAEVPRRRPGVFENTAVNVIGIGLANGLSALSGLVTARVLGAVGVGVLAVSFGLVEFGRALSNFTHIPSVLEVHRGKDERVVFGTSLTLKMLGSLIFVALVAALSPWLATVFNIPAWAVILASSVLIIGSFYEIGTTRLEADNRMVRRNVILATGPAFGFIAIVLLALTGRLTVLTSILTTVAAVTVMSIVSYANHPPIHRFGWERATGSFLARYGGRIVLATILTQGLLWTDTFMVSYLLGNEATGIYSVVFQLTFVMVTASVAVGVALMPALSELHGRGEDTRIGFQRGTLIAGAMSLVLATVFLVAGRPILQIYGADFVAGFPALLILLIFGIAASLAVPATSLLTVHGHAGWVTGVSFAQMLVNVPLNFFLIGKLGFTGAAIATTSVFVAGTLAQWILIHQKLGTGPVSREVITDAWSRLLDWGKA